MLVQQRRSAVRNQTMCNMENIRIRYKPDRVNTLFLGESAPSGGTFFYCANSNLYRCIRSAFTRVYGEGCGEGEAFLQFFRSLGCYLDDLCLEPVNDKSSDERERLRQEGILSLSHRIRRMQPRSVVIVMKAIETHVRNASRRAGLFTLPIYVTTFPAGSDRNKQLCVTSIYQAVECLIAAHILPSS